MRCTTHWNSTVRHAIVGTVSRACFAFVFALLLAAGPLRSDVVAVDAMRSPFCIVAESVKISVGKDMALVEGDYDFKYVRRYDAPDMADRVPFQYEVFAPKTSDSLEDFIAVTQARVHLGSLDFEPEDFILPGQNSEDATTVMPADTRPVILVFRIPRRLLHQQCRLHISHCQLHDRYAGKTVVNFLPSLPDFEALKNELLFSRTDFTIEFEAIDAVQLHRLSANRFVDRETPERLVLHPVDRENIVVEVAAPSGK
jgi:hypothetical protein